MDNGFLRAITFSEFPVKKGLVNDVNIDWLSIRCPLSHTQFFQFASWKDVDFSTGEIVFNNSTLKYEDFILFCVRDILCLLDLDFSHFEIAKYTSMGYSKCLAYNGNPFITIHYNTKLDVASGLKIEFSGQGLAMFNEQKQFLLLKLLNSDKDYYHITRIDLAYNDYNKSFPYDQFYNACDLWKDGYASIITNRNRNCENSLLQYRNLAQLDGKHYKADNMSFGSRSSAFMLRIYDKMLKYVSDKVITNEEETYFYRRIEIEIKKEMPSQVVDKLLDYYQSNSMSDFQLFEENLLKVFANTLCYIVKPIEPNSCSDISQLCNSPIASWWLEFCKTVIHNGYFVSKKREVSSLQRSAIWVQTSLKHLLLALKYTGFDVGDYIDEVCKTSNVELELLNHPRYGPLIRDYNEFMAKNKNQFMEVT